jgi:hypothetical protein
MSTNMHPNHTDQNGHANPRVVPSRSTAGVHDGASPAVFARQVLAFWDTTFASAAHGLDELQALYNRYEWYLPDDTA